MDNPKVSREFIDTYLPSKIKAIVDLETLKVEKESFVEPKLRKSTCDVLLSVRTQDNSKAYVYLLLEHQSTPDHWMSFRLLKYMINI